MSKLLSEAEGTAGRERIVARIRAANATRSGTGFMGGKWYEGVDVGQGWDDILDRLDARIAAICHDYYVSQAKEKFGILRYYVENVPEELRPMVDRLIRHAEEESSRTCEECGAPGRLGSNKSGWLRTLCARCGAHQEGWQFRS